MAKLESNSDCSDSILVPKSPTWILILVLVLTFFCVASTSLSKHIENVAQEEGVVREKAQSVR